MSLIFDKLPSPPQKNFFNTFIFEFIPVQKYFPYSASVIFVDRLMEDFTTPKLCSMLLVKTPDDTVCQKLPNFNSVQVAIADSDIRHTIAFSFML